MPIRFHNSLTRRIEDLVPGEPGHVRMYVCGMTTYDLCHLGHARLFVAFDVVRRWLRARGLRVTYVRNITDIDDKIIARAAELGEPIGALTARYIDAMHRDLGALGIEAPDIEPRATGHIAGMIELIVELEKKGLAYVDGEGDVDFSVRNFPGYGRLSGRSLDELQAGERVGIRLAKRDPLDFALWKRAKPGEPSWDSPWGAGRPGWHIECSAMAAATLGWTIDIHGGGPDLVFPHHENEIAQSEGAHGVPLARGWMHCGALRVGEEKMSKSLGNFLTIRDAIALHPPEVVRFFLLRSHYRGQVAFTSDMLGEARTALTRLYTALRGFAPTQQAPDWNEPHAQRFALAMDDDFNTAGALAEVFELAGELNRTRSPAAAAQLRALGAVLGLLQQDADAFLRGGGEADPGELAAIEALVEQRNAARRARDFAGADRVRAQLLAKGIVLEDGAGGTTWRRA
jgi:cysteinyl-tRNA synthetase